MNRKDPQGRNVFAGGFLGLDNIGVFDRSAPLPTGGSLEQADGTAWMAFYCQNMIEMALILADARPAVRGVRLQLPQHFMWIAYAMDRIGEHHDEMWDEEDGFFYDVLRLPDGIGHAPEGPLHGGAAPALRQHHLRAGCPHQASPADGADRAVPRAPSRGPGAGCADGRGLHRLIGGRRLLSPLSKERLERVLGYLLDENEFLSPYGIRSLSRYHQEHPFVFDVGGQTYSVSYLPAESNTGMFGGNSNWRGPVWMPVNVLIVRGLLNLYAFYGDDFTVECPTGSGNRMTLFEVAHEISTRLAASSCGTRAGAARSTAARQVPG